MLLSKGMNLHSTQLNYNFIAIITLLKFMYSSSFTVFSSTFALGRIYINNTRLSYGSEKGPE